MKDRKTIIVLAVFSILLLAVSNASAVTLTVGNDSVQENQTAQIPITVDDSTLIAGAAFTITYDTTNLTLTDIQSTFFDTFANQWAGLANPPAQLPPNFVTVDSTTYYQPLVFENVVPGTGQLVAAARCTPSNGVQTTLFTLSFQLKEGSPTGTYSVGVTSTTLNNTSAGYASTGETIPMLVGSDLSVTDLTNPAAFPVKLDPPNSIGSVVPGSATFTLLDSDNDGMPDVWEDQKGFNKNDPSDANTDSDQDGYSNLQEYLNDTNPASQDPADGTGYSRLTDNRLCPWDPITGNQYTMVLAGTATADAVDVEIGDCIAAFGPGGDSDVRAVNQVTTVGEYFMTLRGNQLSGENIIFKMRRGSDMKILTSTDTVEFVSDGSISDKVLTFTTSKSQTIPMGENWNWVSFNVLPDDTSLQGFFGANLSNLEQIKTQTTSMLNISGNWIGDDPAIMSKISQFQMFKIKVKQGASFDLTVEGQPLDPQASVPLQLGWTWIAYIPDYILTPEQAIGTIFENIEQLKSQTQSRLKVGTSFIGDMQQMISGEGYTIKMTVSDTLQYPVQP